jgi:hypothetical protein
LHFSPPVPCAVALLILATACPATCAPNPDEKVLVYRLRGEVRPFLFWVGRDDAGGGHISVRRTYSTPTRWREEIEVLFGSEPERVPGHINRWGHGRESGDWTWNTGAAAPLLLGTEFEGIMRHSADTSMDQAIRESGGATAAHPYDVTRSVVLADRAYHEIWVFTDEEEFRYRHPERLLAKYRECIASKPPLRRQDLPNTSQAYREPYGFLTAVERGLWQITETFARSPEALRRMRPASIFVYNAKKYTLDVTGVRRMTPFQTRYGALRLRDVAVVEFRCFNTVKRTRTDFSLWVPLSGDLKGLPVRILLQPRWWLRLQLDLDPSVSRIPSGEERRKVQTGGDAP